MIRSANLTGSISRNAGGLYESVRRLVQSLIEGGVDVRVIGMLDEFTVADIGAWSPARVVSCRISRPKAFGYSRDFMRALIAYKPDLTHTHGLWQYPSVATNNYSRATHSPYVISPHGMLDPWAMKNSRWKKVIAHALYEGTHLRGAACLRALCESEARAMREIGLKNPICIIPNGIDPPAAGSQKAESEKPKAEKKVLLYLGRIHPKKGLVNLLKAWATVPQSDWILEIAGWDQGGHERELKALSSALGVDDSVRFPGPKFGEAKAACYRDCDAFVLSSFSEGVPMVILEAWAHDRPVLMTPECNLPEGFAAGAALRIETNVESIAQGLQNLFAMNAAERAQMGARGLQLARTHFSWPLVANELKQVYEWVLGGGPAPSCLYLR
jgi:glycosyltransferase involved in cell wall biosynthesis